MASKAFERIIEQALESAENVKCDRPEYLEGPRHMKAELDERLEIEKDIGED